MKQRQYRLLSLLMMTLFLTASGCGQNAAHSNEQGVVLYEEEKYDKALVKFNQAITQDGQNSGYYTNRGMTYLMLQQYEEAEADFQKALQMEDTMQTHRGLGILYMNMENYASAISEFEEAVALTGTAVGEIDYDILAHKATAQIMMKDYNGAVETYTTLIQLEVETSENYLRRGILYLKGGESYLQYTLEDFDSAVAAAEAENQGESSQVYEIYEMIYETLIQYGYNTEAQTYVEQAKALTADSLQEIFQRGKLFYTLEEYDAAKELFAEASAQGLTDADYYIAKCAEKQGAYEAAREIYENLMQQETYQTAESYNQLGACLVMLREYTEAEILFEQALALDKDGTMGPYILWNQAVMYENQKEYEKAYQVLLTYEKKFPMGEEEARKLAYLKNR